MLFILQISTLKKAMYDASLKFNSKKNETRKKEGSREISTIDTKKSSSDFMKLFMAVHYTSMMYTCAAHGLYELSAKSSISLLRYAGNFFPVNNAFFIAGHWCRESIQTNLVFMFLNHYVDLIEVRSILADFFGGVCVCGFAK